MKILLLFCCLCFSQFAFAQTRHDYEAFMAKFQQFYNADRADSLCTLGSATFASIKDALFTAQELQEYKKEYGDIMKFTYLTVDSISSDKRQTLFKINSNLKAFILAVALNKDHKFESLYFEADTEFARSFLSNEKK